MKLADKKAEIFDRFFEVSKSPFAEDFRQIVYQALDEYAKEVREETWNKIIEKLQEGAIELTLNLNKFSTSSSGEEQEKE